MNDKNLIPMSQRSLEERQEIGRQGGIKSGEARRKKRQIREIAKMLASMMPPPKK